MFSNKTIKICPKITFSINCNAISSNFAVNIFVRYAPSFITLIKLSLESKLIQTAALIFPSPSSIILFQYSPRNIFCNILVPEVNNFVSIVSLTPFINKTILKRLNHFHSDTHFFYLKMLMFSFLIPILIAASLSDAGALNPNGIITLSLSGVSTFFTKDKLIFISDPRSFPIIFPN